MDRRRLQDVLSQRFPLWSSRCTRCSSRSRGTPRSASAVRSASFRSSERVPQVLHRALIGLVRLRCAERRLGVVLQEKSAHSPNVSCSPLRTISRICCLGPAAVRGVSAAPPSNPSVPVDSRWRCPALSRYRIHQNLIPFAGTSRHHALLGRAILHLLFECGAEGLEIRFQKPDVAAHHAEMGNLLSLDPKIHCLRADAKKRAASRTVSGRSSVPVDLLFPSGFESRSSWYPPNCPCLLASCSPPSIHPASSCGLPFATSMLRLRQLSAALALCRQARSAREFFEQRRMRATS